MYTESPIDWKVCFEASTAGRLVDLLVKFPRTRWSEKDEYDCTLLHRACLGPNVAAAVMLIKSGLVDVSARSTWGATPVHWSVSWEQPRMLEVLCAAGADLRACTHGGFSPIDLTLAVAHKGSGEPAHVLMANGVRLSTVHEKYRHLMTPKLEVFERGVLRCRAAVVAILRVKQAGKLWRWDKFLLREIGFAIWATRWNDEWEET